MKKNRKPRPQPPKWAWMAVGFIKAGTLAAVMKQYATKQKEKFGEIIRKILIFLKKYDIIYIENKERL